MQKTPKLAVLALALVLSTSGCSSSDKSDNSSGGSSIKVGFITKFPVGFYDTMVDAVKAWNKDHKDVEVIFGQGKSGTDDEGEINIIENMISQGVKAIAI